MNKGFETLGLLGMGSTAEVYRVRRLEDGKEYAVKVFDASEEGPSNLDAVRRRKLLNEVLLLHALKHPHIVKFYEAFVRHDDLYVVMELLQGGTLAHLIKQHALDGCYLPEDTIWEYFLQLATAVRYMHSRGVAHRDLKPSNCMFQGAGQQLKVLDLGLAKLLRHSLSNSTVGTPMYAAPEVFNRQPIGFPADVWGLGCILHEMAALTPAFDAISIRELRIKVLQGKVSPLPQQYSQGLRDVIAAMLRREPSKRPTLDELLQHPVVAAHMQRLKQQGVLECSYASQMYPAQYGGAAPAHQERLRCSREMTEMAVTAGSLADLLPPPRYSSLQPKHTTLAPATAVASLSAWYESSSGSGSISATRGSGSAGSAAGSSSQCDSMSIGSSSIVSVDQLPAQPAASPFASLAAEAVSEGQAAEAAGSQVAALEALQLPSSLDVLTVGMAAKVSSRPASSVQVQVCVDARASRACAGGLPAQAQTPGQQLLPSPRPQHQDSLRKRDFSAPCGVPAACVAPTATPAAPLQLHPKYAALVAASGQPLTATAAVTAYTVPSSPTKTPGSPQPLDTPAAAGGRSRRQSFAHSGRAPVDTPGQHQCRSSDGSNASSSSSSRSPQLHGKSAQGAASSAAAALAASFAREEALMLAQVAASLSRTSAGRDSPTVQRALMAAVSLASQTDASSAGVALHRTSCPPPALPPAAAAAASGAGRSRATADGTYLVGTSSLPYAYVFEAPTLADPHSLTPPSCTFLPTPTPPTPPTPGSTPLQQLKHMEPGNTAKPPSAIRRQPSRRRLLDTLLPWRRRTTQQS